MQIETARLKLRNWEETDLEPWIEMNQDPSVMKYFPRLYSPDESVASFNRMKLFLKENNFGIWAVEEKVSRIFIGFVGLMAHDIEGISFMPCTEIGWRLRKEFWGLGYASEAAREVLEYAKTELRLEEIFSFTAELNSPSIRVMQRIGLSAHPELNFLHPRIERSHPLAPHVVYSTTPPGLNKNE